MSGKKGRAAGDEPAPALTADDFLFEDEQFTVDTTANVEIPPAPKDKKKSATSINAYRLYTMVSALKGPCHVEIVTCDSQQAFGPNGSQIVLRFDRSERVRPLAFCCMKIKKHALTVRIEFGRNGSLVLDVASITLSENYLMMWTVWSQAAEKALRGGAASVVLASPKIRSILAFETRYKAAPPTFRVRSAVGKGMPAPGTKRSRHRFNDNFVRMYIPKKKST